MTNLLKNGDFESLDNSWWKETWGAETNVELPEYWPHFWYRGRVEDGSEKDFAWHRPEANVMDIDSIDENRVWRVRGDYKTWECTLGQVVEVQPGAVYRVTVSSYADSGCEDGRVGKIHRILVIKSSDGEVLQESPDRIINKMWQDHTVEFTATSDRIEVVLWMYAEWPMDWNMAEWEWAEMTLVSPAPGPPPQPGDLEARIAALEEKLEILWDDQSTVDEVVYEMDNTLSSLVDQVAKLVKIAEILTKRIAAVQKAWEVKLDE